MRGFREALQDRYLQMLLHLQPGSFSASVVNVELQHLCASGVVDTLVEVNDGAKPR